MNIFKTHPKAVYSCRLGNGTTWFFLAGPGSEMWLEKAASIINLTPCKFSKYGECVRIVYDGINFNEEDRISLKKDGWEVYHRGVSRIWLHGNIPDIICEINKGCDSLF